MIKGPVLTMTLSTPPKPKLLIVGNGMVAGRLLDQLLSRNPEKYDITVIGAEDQGSYNRILLSSVLAKDATSHSIVQKDQHWYRSRGIRFISGTTVNQINKAQRWVSTDTQQQVHYDELILATGSRAARIPAKNLDLEKIFFFRTLADTQAMIVIAQQVSNVIVVGGGLLGLEAAYGLAKFGSKVTVVHRSPWLLNRQLDQHSAVMLQSTMAAMGIEFELNDEIDSFHGEQAITGATLQSGKTLQASMAVIATGITPNIELGIDAGLVGSRAIVVDDYMQTRSPQISALGECIEHRGQTFGLVDPLWRQAETLAARLAQDTLLPFKNQATATKLKVSGVQVFSAGEVQQREGLRAVYVEDKQAKIYRKLLLDNGIIKGIVLFGDVRSGAHYFELMQQQTNVSAQLPNLIFGQELAALDKQKILAA